MSEVAERLLAFFTSGDIAPGTRLPAERTLAASLGVGRSAVREALAALEILGIVVVRPGSGTYLRDGVSELLPRTLDDLGAFVEADAAFQPRNRCGFRQPGPPGTPAKYPLAAADLGGPCPH